MLTGCVLRPLSSGVGFSWRSIVFSIPSVFTAFISSGGSLLDTVLVLFVSGENSASGGREVSNEEVDLGSHLEGDSSSQFEVNALELGV